MSGSPGDSPVYAAFVEKLYGEVSELLVEERDYVSATSKEDRAGLDPQARMLLVQELSSMTRRLTEIMAWLMVHKAVAAGEISAEEADASEAAELFDAPQERRAPPAGLGGLPVEVRGMIDRSLRLHAQVVQLDESRRGGAPEPG